MTYHRTAHIFHFIMSFLTSGLWIPVWVICALRNNQKNREAEFYSNVNRKNYV